MEKFCNTFSRRDLFAVSGLAAGALAVKAQESGLSVPAGPVSVAKVVSYDLDLVSQFEQMFDQIGGLGQRVRGKTVAMKLNLTGGVGRGGPGGVRGGQARWVAPHVSGRP